MQSDQHICSYLLRIMSKNIIKFEKVIIIQLASAVSAVLKELKKIKDFFDPKNLVNREVFF